MDLVAFGRRCYIRLSYVVSEGNLGDFKTRGISLWNFVSKLPTKTLSMTCINGNRKGKKSCIKYNGLAETGAGSC